MDGERHLQGFGLRCAGVAPDASCASSSHLSAVSRAVSSTDRLATRQRGKGREQGGLQGLDNDMKMVFEEKSHWACLKSRYHYILPKSICASLNGDFSVLGEAFQDDTLPPGDPGKQA